MKKFVLAAAFIGLLVSPVLSASFESPDCYDYRSFVRLWRMNDLKVVQQEDLNIEVDGKWMRYKLEVWESAARWALTSTRMQADKSTRYDMVCILDNGAMKDGKRVISVF
jgi:hypothetical protein